MNHTASKYHVTEDRMAEEQRWIEEARKDPRAFEPLYNRYHEAIFRFIYQRVTDKDTAFDATSDVFLKALLNLYRFRFRGLPFASWLYRIASNVVNDLFKAQKAERAIHIDTPGLQLMAETAEWEDKEWVLIQKMQIGQAMATLDPADLQLVEMRFFEKRPFKEIAHILDITENNAKVRLYRVLDKLKKRLTMHRP